MKRLMAKKYFVHLLTTLLVLSAVLVLALSSVLSANFRSVLRDSEQRNSMNSLAQISFGRESMDMLASNMGRILLSNSSVVAAMTSGTYNSITSTAALNVMNTVTVGTGGVDSIYLYNVQQQTITCSLTGETVPADAFYDQGAKMLVNQIDASSTFLPVFRELSGDYPIGASSQVYSYTFPYRTGRGLAGVIIINIKTLLLSDMIRSLSERGNRYTEDLFAVDLEGNVVCSMEYGLEIPFEDQQPVIQRCLNEDSMSDAFAMPLSDGRDYLVTFSRSAEGDWIFISLSDMAQSFRQIRLVLIQTVLVSLCALATAAGIAIFFARRLYQPVGHLYSAVSTQLNGQDLMMRYKAQDEFSAVSEAFSQIALSAQQLEVNTRQNRYQVQNGLKARLLNGEFSLDQNWVQQRLIANDLHISIANGSRYLLIQMRIDYWEEVRLKMTESELDIISYGMINVADELLAQPYQAFGAYMGEGIFCFCLTLEQTETENGLFEAAGAVECVQSKIEEIFSLTISIAVSGIFVLSSNFSEAYRQLEEIAQYRFVAGHGCIVDESVLKAVDNEYYLVTAKQKKSLMESIRQGKIEQVHQLYQEISDQVSRHNYQNMLDTYLYLAYIIYSECFIVELKQSDFSVLMLSFMGKLSQYETRQEVDDAFCHLFGEINLCIQEMNQKQTPDIVEQVVGVIQTSYADKNLCLNVIAQQVNRSAAYVGRLFKEQTDCSVSEYILKVRMQHLKELLDTTSLSLSEILDRVGMEKNNYFYTLFRKHFGISFVSYQRGQDEKNAGSFVPGNEK